MTSTSSISGLISGLDTSSIISQLMTLEARPQTTLKNRLAAGNTQLSTLQSLNASFASLATAAKAMATTQSWGTMSVSSSSTNVTASVGGTAQPGQLSLTIGQLAGAGSLSFRTTAARTDVVTSGSTSVVLTDAAGTATTIDTGDGTLDGLVKGLNASGAKVSASTVRLDDGRYRLNVVSTATGAASSFTLTNTDGTDLLGGADAKPGQDAAITVGSDTIHSASNVFENLSGDLDVTLGAGVRSGDTVTLTVARDSGSASKKVQDLVDRANALLTKLDSLTSHDSATGSSGALADDATVRSLRSKVLETVTRAADGSSLSTLGIQTTSDGAVTFDSAKFATAYAKDPDLVARRLGAPDTDAAPGWATRLATVADAISDTRTGSLTSDITARQSMATRMQASIAAWDVKLAGKQESLEKMYAGMESALRTLKSQSDYLTTQLDSLTKSSKDS